MLNVKVAHEKQLCVIDMTSKENNKGRKQACKKGIHSININLKSYLIFPFYNQMLI